MFLSSQVGSGESYVSPFGLGLEDGASNSLLSDDASRLTRMQHSTYSNQTQCMSSEAASYQPNDSTSVNDSQTKRDKEAIYGYV